MQKNYFISAYYYRKIIVGYVFYVDLSMTKGLNYPPTPILFAAILELYGTGKADLVTFCES